MKISFSPLVILAVLFGLLLQLGLISGCSHQYHGTVTLGFRQSTNWEVYQQVVPDDAGKVDAGNSTNWDSLFGWIKALWVDGASHVPDAADGVSDPASPLDQADPPDEARIEEPVEVTP